MKKKLISIMLTFAMIITSAFIFSGCGILQNNNKRYYADAVAKVGDEVVTRNEVLTMFNYYYYSYGYYQYGYSEEQVYTMVLESLIKNKIIVQEARKLEECKLNDDDRAYIWEQVFENISSQIDSHETEIKKIYGIEEDSEEDNNSTETKFTEYERAKAESELATAKVVKTKDEWLKSIQSEADEKTNKYRYLAYRKFVNELVKSAKMYDKNAGSEEKILEQEIDRLFKYYEESRLVAKYTVLKTATLTVTSAEINDYYNELKRKQSQSFQASGAYESAITSTSSTELVIKRSESTKYFTVQHILLKFADYDDTIEVSTNVKGASQYLAQLPYFTYQKGSGSIESQLEEEYLKARENYASEEGSLDLTYINPKTGKTNCDDNGDEKKLTKLSEFDAIINKYVDDYNNALSTYNASEKTEEDIKALQDAEHTLAEEFFKLKFSYSKDSNVTNLTNLTNLIGYTFSQNKLDSNSYVAEFSETAYELYDEFRDNQTYGIKKVVTNFGVHYIMFTGEVKSEDLALEDTFTMVRTQTVEDYIFDKLLSDKVTNKINDLTSLLYNEYKSNGDVEIICKTYEECNK